MIDPRVQCWWELAVWPLESAAGGTLDPSEIEICSANFGDVRKRIFLLMDPRAGNIDLYARYGKAGIAYDINNWSGSWGGRAEPTPARAGEVTVLFKDAAGNEDIYINNSYMNEGDLENQLPVRPNLLMGPGWRLAPNPNRYHHWDHNAGKPAAGAEGRWEVAYYAAVPSCDQTEYTFRSEVYKRLPRQVDPYRQIPPVKYLSTQRIEQRHQGVELEKQWLMQDLAPTHARSLIEPKYEGCKRPRRIGEYRIEAGHQDAAACTDPTSECSTSGQCAWDKKINEAYQDQVIAAAERSDYFLKPVDAEWIANWRWAQTKSLWTITTDYDAGTVVYKTTEDDEVMYYCTAGHTASAANEPGVGGSWEDNWTTPAYNPEYVREQPVYVELGGNLRTIPATSYSWMWGANDSPFELLLRDLGGDESVYPAWSADHGLYGVDDVIQFGDICKRSIVAHDSAADKDPTNGAYWGGVTQFDWFWDDVNPAVPYWLYMLQYEGDPVDWPLPRGCWRRTWKHSPGRVGPRMWPGEKGDPPGYESVKMIVSQADYDAIYTAANRKFYAVRDVETLHDAAYGDDEEALIAKRHDPVHTRHIEYVDKSTGENAWAHHPVYELYHDLINDLRNVLLQLHLVDDTGLNVATYIRQWDVGAGWGLDVADNSLEAYALGRASVIEVRTTPRDNPFFYPISGGFDDYGLTVTIDHYFPPSDPDYFSTQAHDTEIDEWIIDITKAGVSIAIDIGTILIRVGYKGKSNFVLSDEIVKEGGLIGFGNMTVFAEPYAAEKNKYIRLQLDEEYLDTLWTFNAEVLDDWPATGSGEFFDFDSPPPNWYYKTWVKMTMMDVAGNNMNKWIILDYDWDLIPEDVFDDDLTTAIEVP